MSQKVEVRFEGNAGGLVSAAEQAKSALASIQKSAAGLKDVLEGMGAAFAAEKLAEFGRQVFDFGKESAKAFSEEESASRTLYAALQATGRGGKESFEQIRQAVERVGEETGHLDDELLGATAKLAEFAKKLSAGDLAKAQTAIVGLSELAGKTFEESASMIGRSLAGTRNLLTRYIGDMDKNLSQSEKLAVMNQRLAASYEVAKDRVNSAEGAMRVMHNGMVRLQEAIGGIILRAFGFQSGMRDIGKALEALAKYLRDNAGEFAAWGQMLVATMKAVVAGARDTVAAVRAIGQAFAGHPIDAVRAMAAAVGDMAKTEKDLAGAIDTFRGSKHTPLDLLSFGDMKVPDLSLSGHGDDTVSKAAKKNAMKYTEFFKYWVDWFWANGNTGPGSASALAGALGGKLNGGALAAQGGGFAQIDQLGQQITNDAATLRLKMKFFDVGSQAGESFIRGMVQGSLNLRGLLISALEQMAEYFLLPAFQGALGSALGLPTAAMAGAGAGGGSIPSLSVIGAGGGVNVAHTTNISINALDPQLFHQYAMKNRASIGAAAAMAAYQNPQLAAVMSGGGR